MKILFHPIVLILTMLVNGLMVISCLAQNQFEKDIVAFEKSDQANLPPNGAVLFVGSSSIRMWRSLGQDFPQVATLNRGFGGSQTTDVIHFFDRVVAVYKPSKVILYEGDNDLASGKSPTEVAGDFESFVKLVRINLPGIRIAFISIKPSPARFHLLKEIQQANQLIKSICQAQSDLTFVDVFEPMMGKNGRPMPHLFLKDSLHMTSAGYQIWKNGLESFVGD